MAPRRFPVRFTGLNRAMAVIGMSPRNSHLDVGDDVVEVRMGWAFAASAPRTSIRGASLDDRRVFGWGVHGWRGRWLVNGSSHGIVRMQIEPPVRARLMSLIPVSLRELRISVGDPDGLVDALND